MPTTTEKKTLKAEDLSHFTGTVHDWRTGMPWHPFVYTDGVRHVITSGEAFWLLDLIGSWQPEPKVKDDPMLREMQFWTLTVEEDRSGEICCERDKRDVVVRQVIPYTDFPLSKIRFYLAQMWCYWEYSAVHGPRTTNDHGVLLLPSEY